jgi:hypothetical protein
MHVFRWLAEAGIAIETGVELREVTGDALSVRCPDGAEEQIPCDSVIVCQGREPENALARELDGKVPEVLILGDAKMPRSYGNAIHEAAYLARQLG